MPNPNRHPPDLAAMVELFTQPWRAWMNGIAGGDRETGPPPSSGAAANFLDPWLDAFKRIPADQRELLGQTVAAVAGLARAEPWLAQLAMGAPGLQQGRADAVIPIEDSRRLLQQWFHWALITIVQPRSLATPSFIAQFPGDALGVTRVWRRLGRAGLGMARSLLACSKDATARFESRTRAEPAHDPARRHALWLESCDAAYAAMVREPRFSRRYGRLVNASLRVFGQFRQAGSVLAAIVDAPTRAEFDELVAQMQRLKTTGETGAERVLTTTTPRKRKKPDVVVQPIRKKTAAKRSTPAKKRASPAWDIDGLVSPPRPRRK